MRFTDMADEMFGAAQGALPALGLAAAVPTAWFVWGVWAEPPLPLPPEQLLEPPRTLDPATLLDLPEPVA